MTTSSRLLALLSLLQSRRDWPGSRRAERLDVSTRTVRRDVDRLREMDYRITATKGPDGGYRLEAGSELPPLLFDDDQAVALAVALRIAASSGVDIGESALRALTTVRQVMPSRLRHRIDALQVTSAGPPYAAVDPDLLLTVSAAVRAHEVLRFDYNVSESLGPDDELPRPRRVEPHHVVSRSGRWYLVAWDLDRHEWRIYRIDRMAPRTPTGPRFQARQVPGEGVAAFVSARFKGSDGADQWLCTGEVVLALSAREVSPFVVDGVVEGLGPGRCRLVLRSWSWSALAAAIGRFDANIEIIGPPALVDAFSRLGERYARAAGSGSSAADTTIESANSP